MVSLGGSQKSQFGRLNFDRLQVLEFDSDRKRMSVIVRDSKGVIRLVCKGAEVTILPRCQSKYVCQNSSFFSWSKKRPQIFKISVKSTYTLPSYLYIHSRHMDNTIKHINKFATEGLRTMAVAVKTLRSQSFTSLLLTDMNSFFI